MSLLEMIAVEGLDEAVIGTGLRTTGKEVLVYDANKAQEIIDGYIGEGMDVTEYLFEIGIDALGDQAPIFVYLDENAEDELRRARRESYGALH